MSLELIQVSKGFGSCGAGSEILTNINLTINEGEFVAIVGFTGSGKSTLVKMIAGLLSPDQGKILFNGEPVSRPSKDRGIIFQNYSLLPWLTVKQNVMLAVNAVYPQWDAKQRDEHTRKYIEMVHLGPAIHKRPAELSGGMRQRVSVARTLAMNPALLLMDEPLSALDAITRASLQQEIVNIWSENRTTALLITNDVDEGIFMADRIIPLTPGPGATLGPAFNINLERPRDKTALNDNPEFIKVRNGIVEYLLDMSNGISSGNNLYALPEAEPVMPGSFFKRLKKAA